MYAAKLLFKEKKKDPKEGLDVSHWWSDKEPSEPKKGPDRKQLADRRARFV